MIRKRKDDPWSGSNRAAHLDSMFNDMAEEAKRELNLDVSVALPEEQIVIGLALPALALRYLFASDVLSLGRTIQIVGQEGSAKTTLLIELMRLHAANGGGGAYIQNENKESPDLCYGIMQYRRDWLQRIRIVDTSSMEEWQKTTTYYVEATKKAMDKKDGPGRSLPVVIGIDSLMGTASESDIAKTRDAGFSSRGFAIGALLVSRYAREILATFHGYPITIIGTNHLKPGTDQRGLPMDNVPGGKAVPFQATYMIKMQRVSDISLSDHDGLRLKLTCTKNSLGPSRRSIHANFIWWYGKTGNEWRQEFAWDWHSASIELLLAFQTAKGKAGLYKELNEILQLRPRRSDKRISSPALGISDDSPVSYREAGEILESRQDLLDAIYPILGIKRRILFVPGVDYQDLATLEKRQSEVIASQLYGRVSSLPEIGSDANYDDNFEVESDELVEESDV